MIHNKYEWNEIFRPFLKFTAICSFLGAITTALLIFLPNPSASDFDAQVLLFDNNLYRIKLWILFIHPQVNILASLGIAYLLVRRHPLQLIAGTLFLLIWAYTEISQQSLLIDALNQIWRPGYVEAETSDTKNMYFVLINAANGISDSKYFLVIYGFGFGSLLYGFAFIREQGAEKWIGVSLIFIGTLSLCSFARYYLDATFLDVAVQWTYQWIYPYLQPATRIAMGVWILQIIKRTN